jgi:hypothetical protein
VAAPTLDEARTYVGGNAPDVDATDALRLAEAWAAAVEALEGRVASSYVDGTNAYPAALREAILLLTHRLYTRASSPLGVAGFDAQGNAFRVLATDADLKTLVGPYLDLAAGFA